MLIIKKIYIIDHKATGQFMKRLRKASGNSLSDVAKAMKISVSYLCDLEHGRKKWSEKLTTKYYEAL